MLRITMRLGEQVEDENRRQRRGAAAIGLILVAAAVIVVASSRSTGPAPPPAPPPSPRPNLPPAAAQLSPLPAGLTFAPQLAGTASAPQLVRLRNDGDAPLSIASLQSDREAFRITHDCTAPLGPRESCTAAVSFVPASGGAQQGTLLVETNGGAARIALNGNAEAVPPADLGTLNFGRSFVGQASPARTLRFTNNSPLPLAIAATAVPPPFVAAADTCGGATLQSGGACEVALLFRPDQGGAADGELRLLDGQKNVVARAALRGEGMLVDVTPQPPQLVPSISVPPEVNFKGDPGRRQVLITNGLVPLRLRVLPDPSKFYRVDGSDCTNRQLAAGERCTVVIAAAPAAIHGGEATRIVIAFEGGSAAIRVLPR